MVLSISPDEPLVTLLPRFSQGHALARLGKTENFVGKISVMEKQSWTSAPCRSRGVRFAILKAFSAALRAIENVGASFLSRRQIVGRVTVAKRGRFASVAADFVQISPGNQNYRCRAIGDLRTVGNFKRRRHARVFIETCDAQSRVRSASHICASGFNLACA